MAAILWDSQCVFMVNYLEEGHAINGAYCTEELRRQEIVKKRKVDSRRSALAR